MLKYIINKNIEPSLKLTLHPHTELQPGLLHNNQPRFPIHT